jgi:methylenetetrahydrofolate--tRNA-(uracil-5-)-methyltransferase
MKPRGLPDPRTGREPWAVLQLRRESRQGSLMGLVGFQTRMTWGSQKQLLAMLPGFANASVLRYGSIHRNIFLYIPGLCRRYLADHRRDGLYFAGQICGVEGYVESIASGIVVALEITARAAGRKMPPLPDESMLGALMNYVHTPTTHFQPMNANFGILPAPKVRSKRERHAAAARLALESMRSYRKNHDWLFV